METGKSVAPHGGFTRLLHWTTSILVLAAFVLGPGGSEAHVYSQPVDLQRRAHETLGLAVLALTVIRICWHSMVERPVRTQLGAFTERASAITHLALYTLLAAVPLSAIAGVWLQGYPLTWIGGDVVAWVPTRHDAGRFMANLHGWLGDAILWIAGLHACAALTHHFILKDGVLAAMLPFRTRSE